MDVRRSVGDTLRKFNFLSALRENQHLKRTCRECLELYRSVEHGYASASATKRYALVIAKRTGADARGVNTIMRRVEESFASVRQAHSLASRKRRRVG